MHYVTNVESEITRDTAQVRAQFYNPIQIPGFSEPSYCGGYYHMFVRTTDGWRSRNCGRRTSGSSTLPLRRGADPPPDRPLPPAFAKVSPRFGIWTMLGFVVYFVHGRRHSRLATDPNYSREADAEAARKRKSASV